MTYTETTTTSYGSRILNSIKWIIFWFLMFIASFFILWINEWSVDMSKIAKTSIQIDNSKVNPENNEKLVSITWKIKSNEKLWDEPYLKKWDYIIISRKVEMYSWAEDKHTETEKNLWWSETTTTKYDYYKEWTEFPEDSTSFKVTEGHYNPPKKINSTTKRVSNIQIWVFNANTSNLDLNTKTKLDINNTNTNLKTTWTWATQIINWYIFEWSWSMEQPKIWDIRISYNVLKQWEKVTLMWSQNNNEIESFYDKDWNKLFRVFYGTRADAIKTLRTEYLTKLWILRWVWFLLMFFWLMLLLEPISVLLDVLPIAGTISRTILWIAAFLIALILSILTILISTIFHNIVVLIITILLITWLIIYYIKNRQKEKETNLNINQNTKWV